LLRLPAGVRLMLAEWSMLRDRLKKSTSLLGTQRQRCLALLGKCREDALRDDPGALRRVRALFGAVHGNTATPEQVDNLLGGFLPVGMGDTEYEIRVKELAGSLPTKAEAHAQLVAYVAEEISRLEEHLAVLEPLAERNLALDAQKARMDVTPEGTRLAGQVLASYRGSDAALRRVQALQNPPRRGPGRGSKNAGAPAPEPPAAPTPSDPVPTPAMTPKTAEAIATPNAGEPDSQPRAVEAISAPTAVEPDSPPRADEAISTPHAAERDSQPRADEAISTPHAAEPDSQPRADEAISTPNAVEAIAADSASGDDREPYAAEQARLSRLQQPLEAIYGSRRNRDDQASGAVAPAGRAAPADAASRPAPSGFGLPPSAFESGDAGRGPPGEDTS
jgi:hypothetical protein